MMDFSCGRPVSPLSARLRAGGGRRETPRAPAMTLCTEHGGDAPWDSMVLDLSETGLRLQGPLGGRRERGVVPVEFELPEVDEVVWAGAEVCFDEVWQVPGRNFNLSGFLRTRGLRLVSITERHRRLIRDYTRAVARPRPRVRPAGDPLTWLSAASCYRRG